MLVQRYSVFCDADLCSRWVADEVEAREARKIARRHGWKRIPRPGGPDGKGADLCPVHAKEK
jgi:hypothetical protein